MCSALIITNFNDFVRLQKLLRMFYSFYLKKMSIKLLYNKINCATEMKSFSVSVLVFFVLK